jgi:TetR/AcrR family transcriptional repressor of nem operon
MSRPRRSEHTREALISNGIEQLSLHGYHGTGIKQILDEVKVPKGSFYNFFASKEAFVAEIIEQYSRDFLEKLKQFVTNEGKALSPVQQLQSMYQYNLEYYANGKYQKSCLVGALATEISAESSLCRVQLEKASTQWTNFFTCLFEQAQVSGEIRTDLSAHSIASLYWATWEGALMTMKLTETTEPALKIMDIMLNTLLLPNQNPVMLN